MWCSKCKRKSVHEKCEQCGETTQHDIPSEIFWCSICNVPVIKFLDSDDSTCPICGTETKYLSKDIRPVFPEERLLIECLMAKPLAWINDSVWANDSRYYINGKTKQLPVELLKTSNVHAIIVLLNKFRNSNSYNSFERYIDLFIKVNKNRLADIKNEAMRFVVDEVKKFKSNNIVISFSGGKDSTVVADLVVRALSDPSVVQIFGDTTLEFPMTYDYLARHRLANPKAIIKTAKNKDQDFYAVCEDIGPPARMMRWCCTMFKTGPITRTLNNLFQDSKILTFYGIRKNESVSRSKYNRVEDDATQIKIKKQTVASPIFYWIDADIWLYMLGEQVDFNDAYRLGYDRVGCWCCPNNNVRAQFLAKLYMPEQSKKWRDYLISFAKQIGKPDAEEYIDGGWWKARQGGNGVEAANDIKIRFTNCTSEENAKVYSINKPIDDTFYELMIPFGEVKKELGRKLINEVIIVDIQSKVPIISIQPFSQQGYEHSVKIKTMNVKDHDGLQRMIGYQIRKYNACRKCLKCESICSFNAITIVGEKYKIDPQKCKRCKMCVTAKYLDGGCLMDKFLKVRQDKE